MALLEVKIRHCEEGVDTLCRARRSNPAHLVFILLLTLCLPAKAARFLDISTYGDIREFGTITLVADYDLTEELEYFSFTNLDFNFLGQDYSYYSEQDLFLQAGKIKYLDFASQYVLTTGEENNAWRLGNRLKVSEVPALEKFFKAINMKYSFSLYPFQIDRNNNYEIAMEHYYRIQILPSIFKDRVYFSGFWDHNLSLGDGHVSVTENQIGIRLYRQLYLVTEMRYNGIIPREQVGLGVGMEYFLRL